MRVTRDLLENNGWVSHFYDNGEWRYSTLDRNGYHAEFTAGRNSIAIWPDYDPKFGGDAEVFVRVAEMTWKVALAFKLAGITYKLD